MTAQTPTRQHTSWELYPLLVLAQFPLYVATGFIALKIYYIYVIVLTVPLLCTLILNNTLPKLNSPLILLLVFSAATAWHAYVSTQYPQSLAMAIAHFSTWIICILVIYILQNYELRYHTLFFTLVPIIFAAVNMIITIKYGMIRAQNRLTHQEIGSYCNHMIALVELSVPFLVAQISKNKSTWLYYCSLMALFFDAFLSQSRAGIGIALLGTVLSLVLFQKKVFNKQNLKRAAYCLGAFFLLLQTPVAQNAIDRMSQASMEFDNVLNEDIKKGEEGVDKRIIMYNFGIEVVRDHFWDGLGYNQFQEEIQAKHNVRVIPHNLFLELIADFGALGFFLFLVILAAALLGYLNKLRRLKHSGSPEQLRFYQTALFAFLIFLAHGQFRPTLLNPMLYYFLAVGLTPALLRSSSQSPVESAGAPERPEAG